MLTHFGLATRQNLAGIRWPNSDQNVPRRVTATFKLHHTSLPYSVLLCLLWNVSQFPVCLYSLTRVYSPSGQRSPEKDQRLGLVWTADIILMVYVKFAESVHKNARDSNGKQKQMRRNQPLKWDVKQDRHIFRARNRAPGGLRWRGNVAQQRSPWNRVVQLVDWCYGVEESKKLIAICSGEQSLSRWLGLWDRGSAPKHWD